jgi:hypothetical protein
MAVLDCTPVAPELDRFDLGSERELTNAPVLVVVPDHHLVRRVARVVPAADQGEDVAAEEHLDNPNPAVQEVCATQVPAGRSEAESGGTWA